MREQLKEMEVELLQYHKSNAALDLMIGTHPAGFVCVALQHALLLRRDASLSVCAGELKLKKEGMQRDNDSVLAALSSVTSRVDCFRADVHAALGHVIGKDYKVWRRPLLSLSLSLKFAHV